MSHRLLHTLVFASTSLLACGGQIGEIVPELPEPDASPPDPPLPNPPPPIAAPETSPADAGFDARTCEGGWPTTKGQICTFDAGLVCCSRSWDPDAGKICCEKSP